jgi:nitroimidazol reductase NimA-like FMN-containing flavoprotein (pyridoxamine 5'-phosphate oxidase superfamily)
MQKNQLTVEEIEALLEQAHVGRLGLTSEDGAYVVPLNFVYLDGKVFFHGRRTGHKLDCLARDPRACFEVDVVDGYRHGPTPCATTTFFRSVVAFCRAAVTDDQALVERVLKKFSEKYSPQHVEPVIPPDKRALTAVIEATVLRWTGKFCR